MHFDACDAEYQLTTELANLDDDLSDVEALDPLSLFTYNQENSMRVLMDAFGPRY